MFNYNDQGYRTQKKLYTFSGYQPYITETINYTLLNDKVIYETNGTYGILFTYDYDGTLISFNYDSNINDSTVGIEYYYIRNLMGDITHIINSSGTELVHYIYDAYGNITIDASSANMALAKINPYRYREYRYDNELSWYYLNSRYYNPQVGRFINADGLLGQVGDILSTNMFAYCANNPVFYIDTQGSVYNYNDAFFMRNEDEIPYMHFAMCYITFDVGLFSSNDKFKFIQVRFGITDLSFPLRNYVKILVKTVF